MAQQDLFEQSVAGEAALPFRLEPRTADDRQVDELNRRLETRGVGVIERTDAALERARCARSAVAARLRALLIHPDERVPLAVVSEGRLLRGKGELAVAGRRLLLLRAVQEARGEGMVWTPLLDAIDSAEISRLGDRPIDPAAAQLAEGMPYAAGMIPGRDEILGPVRAWVEEQRDPRTLEPLLAYHASSVPHAIAIRARAWDSALLARMLEAAPDVASSIALNEHVEPELRERLLAWAFERLEDQDAPDGPLRRVGASVVQRFIEQEDAARGDALIERLLGCLKVAIGEEGAWGETTSGQALTVLRSYKDRISSDGLVRCVRATTASWDIEFFALGRHAGPEVWEEALLRTPSGRLRRRIAEIERARRDPAVAGLLAGSGQEEVLEALAGDVHPSIFGRVFRRFVEASPERALEVLEDRVDEVSDTLDADDVAPLLSAPEREVRGRAFGVLSRIGRKGAGKRGGR